VAPQTSWVIASQVLLIAIIVLALDSRVADASPVLLLLAFSGLAASLLPNRQSGEDRDRGAPGRADTGPAPSSIVRAGDAASLPLVITPTPHTHRVGDANVVAPSSALIAQMCHELRTPLNAVIGFSSLMADEIHGPVGDPRYQEYVDHIVESGQSLLRSADATLALTTLLSRPTGVTLGAVDLREAVLAAATEVSGSLRADLGETLGGSGTVLADRHALIQALHHLMAHAAVTSPAGEPVPIVRVNLQTSHGHCRLSLEAPHARSATTGLPLAFLMARTLLALQGVELTITPQASGGWSAAACLPVG
jgi:signal transduction histidine kinase